MFHYLCLMIFLIQYFRIKERFTIISIAEILLNITPVILLYLFMPTEFSAIIAILIVGVTLVSCYIHCLLLQSFFLCDKEKIGFRQLFRYWNSFDTCHILFYDFE